MRIHRPPSLPVYAVVLLAACAAPSTERQESSVNGGGATPEGTQDDVLVQDGAGDDGGGYPVHGSVTTRAVSRSSGDDSDFDLYAYADVDVGDENADAFTARFSGRASWEVDGDEGDDFDGIEDTYDSLNGRIYDAYVQYHGLEDVPLLRLGRQSDYETPEFLVYDGVHLESRELGEHRIQVGAFGGVSTHQFESSPDGDSLYGVYVEGRPWQAGRARVDWVHADDELGASTFEEDLYALSLWQTVGERLRLQGSWSLLADDSRDVDARATWYDVDSELVVQLAYYELFETQAANPLEFDTFSDTLFDYFPYYRVALTASKRLSDRVNVDVGLNVRQVDDSDDEQEFNRDVERYFVTTTLEEFFDADTSLSLTGDVWESDDQETYTWGALVAHEFTERVRGSLGTYFSAYKFDSLLVEEREDVRTYSAALERDVSESTVLEVSYDFEDADIDEYQTLRINLRWRF